MHRSWLPSRIRIETSLSLLAVFRFQSSSTANGKLYIDDSRNRLYKEFVQVLREALPQAFCFENVPGLANMDDSRVIKQVCEDFAAFGYNLTWEFLNAADFGVTQRRKRVFFIGRRNDAMTVDSAA